jgi:F0F1-type ATP synthase gamma subunit
VREAVEEELHFIFEPELPKIVDFFENQIRSILLNRVLLEVELSVTASRLQAMSRAKEHAQTALNQKRAGLTKATHSLINARLLESLTRLGGKG